jgi:DNA (cytosine-5)-methyltransferase 1
LIDDKSPKFFVIENVEGILRSTHKEIITEILSKLSKLGNNGYNIYYKLLNAKDFEVPQDRKRVFFIGIDKKITTKYKFPNSSNKKVTIKDAIFHFKDFAKSHKTKKNKNEKIDNYYLFFHFKDFAKSHKTKKNKNEKIDNYYLDSDWSPQFMTRNRVREWNEVAFTVPASGRHVTMHPQAPKMVKTTNDKFKFKEDSEKLYKRLENVLVYKHFPMILSF